MVHAQQLVIPPTKDLFTMQVGGAGEDRYIDLEPDSTTGNTLLDAQCKALFWHNTYLFENHSRTARYAGKLEPLLPDTALVRSRLDSAFTADTTFRHLYSKAMTKEPVADLPIDTALKVAAHFFYLHSERGKPVVHVCVGINKVKSLSTAPAHPYHAAFCYQTIWTLDGNFDLFDQVQAPYSEEFKKQPPTETRILEVEQLVYDGMATMPELRQALIDSYERKKEHLNFRLVH